MSRNLHQLLADLGEALSEVSPQHAAALLSDLERLKTILWIRLLTTPAVNSPPETTLVEDQLLTIPQLADLLAIPKGHAYELARRRVIPTVRFGKYIRVRLSDFREWVVQHQEKGLDRSLYSVYSHGQDDRRGTSAHPKAARAHAGKPGGPARRYSHHRRPVGARRSTNPRAHGPVDPAVGRDEEQTEN